MSAFVALIELWCDQALKEKIVACNCLLSCQDPSAQRMHGLAMWLTYSLP